jgi:hypothetical protein
MILPDGYCNAWSRPGPRYSAALQAQMRPRAGAAGRDCCSGRAPSGSIEAAVTVGGDPLDGGRLLWNGPGVTLFW